MVLSAEEFVENLRKADFAIEDWSALASGRNNLAILANGEWVLRTAIYGEESARFEIEVDVLRRIHERLPVQSPNPELVIEVHGCLSPVMGYRFIPGTILKRAQISQFDGSKRRRLGNELGRILTRLHSITPEQMSASKAQWSDTPNQWNELLDDSVRLLKPRVESDVWNRIRRKLKKSLSKINRFEFEPVLRHGDFGSGNLVFDDKGRIVGLIDFDSVGFGDPAIDVAGVISSTTPPELLLESMSQTYLLTDEIIERARTYRETFPLQQALLGARTDDEIAIEDGLDGFLGA